MFNTIACDVIVPVPLHWSRRFMRGFNQAREMGEVLAHKKKCACAELVRRTRHTAYQADLAVALRAPNVKNAFELTKSASRYRGTHMVLLDDVMTTGSTLRAVATVLLKIKPASLTIVVACRAPVNVNH
jgi:ComF family protein